MNFAEIRDAYIDSGLSYERASARACQDAFIMMLSSSDFRGKVTFKGGIVMQQVSGDRRRATQDIDVDFMRYSISDESIASFIAKLNSSNAEYSVDISGPIEELKHQDYCGKRVLVVFSDAVGNSIRAKLDIGVHRNLELEQRIISFDVAGFDGEVALLANSNEQLIAEKMRSLLRLGSRSTRFKDVFDIYYLLVVNEVDGEKLDRCMEALVFQDDRIRERCWQDVSNRLERVFSDRRFVRNLSLAKNNWLDLPVGKVLHELLAQVKMRK